MTETPLEHAIFNTVRYFNLFEQPVTATQIWRNLVVGPTTGPTRWSGHRVYGLADIQGALASSVWLKEKLGTKWGYYFLRGQDWLVAERLKRHRLAQMKWKITRRSASWLNLVPLIKMTAMSGSLSVGNTRPTSDLDIFVVARRGRIWLARLLMLAAAQLTGRRRKYWNQAAPDKICLNHYVTDESLIINSEIHNLYTAILYRYLWPLSGFEMYLDFQRANAGWTKHWLMYPAASDLPPVLYSEPPRAALAVKDFIENLLAEPAFDWLERTCERWQRRSIARHTEPSQGGRVYMSGKELAFHPASKAPGLLEKYFQDEGQRTLL